MDDVEWIKNFIKDEKLPDMLPKHIDEVIKIYAKTYRPMKNIIREVIKLHEMDDDVIEYHKNKRKMETIKYLKYTIKFNHLPHLSSKQLDEAAELAISKGLYDYESVILDIAKRDNPEKYNKFIDNKKIAHLYNRAKIPERSMSVGSRSRSLSFFASKKGSLFSPLAVVNPKIKKYSKIFLKKNRTESFTNDYNRYIKRTPRNIVDIIGFDPGDHIIRETYGEKIVPHIKNIPPSLKNMILWRGTDVREGEHIISSSQTQGYYIFTAHRSTTLSKSIAKRYAVNVLLRIKSPIGQRLIPVKKHGFDFSEYVIPKGTKLIVDKIHENINEEVINEHSKYKKTYKFIIEGHLVPMIFSLQKNPAGVSSQVTAAIADGLMSAITDVTLTTVINNFNNPEI